MHREFTVHMLTEGGKAKAVLIAKAFDDLLTTLEGVCMPGRELAVARTKLEEACFFAKKAMANENSMAMPDMAEGMLTEDSLRSLMPDFQLEQNEDGIKASWTQDGKPCAMAVTRDAKIANPKHFLLYNAWRAMQGPRASR